MYSVCDPFLFPPVVILDPGIAIDKGYPAYDHGISQDVFIKVDSGCTCVFVHFAASILLCSYYVPTHYAIRTPMVITLKVQFGQEECTFQTSTIPGLRNTGRMRYIYILLLQFELGLS